MNDASRKQPPRPERFELRFASLHLEGRSYSFPCDAAGRVNIDTLSEGERRNYLFARAAMGREFGVPSVRPILEEDDLAQKG